MFQQKVEVTGVYQKNRKSKARYTVNVGGARSSKSYSIAQLFIEKFTNERHKNFLITRKTMPALRLTAYKLIVDLMKLYQIYDVNYHNKSENKYEFGTNFMLFTSIDDPEKIKSSEWNYIWLEEANEFTWVDFITLETRLSGRTTLGKPNQIYFSFNPEDENHWINQKVVLNRNYIRNKKVETIYSSYKDNPFLDEAYIELLEELKDEDPNYWRIYGLGKWGRLQNIIYPQYKMETEYPGRFDEVIYGVDFGFNNPSVLIEIGEKDKEFYLTESVYQTHLTNDDFIEKFKEAIPEEFRQRYIYADNSEPARIEEISRAGFNIHPAEKSVKDGIDFCKRQKFHSKAENVHTNKENQNYKYKEDRNGRVLDEPLKFNDHSQDAIRYGIYTHYGIRKQRIDLGKAGKGGHKRATAKQEW